MFYMQFHNSIKKVAVVVSGLLLWLLMPACSDSGGFSDIPDDPKMCTVSISLQTANGMHPETKAEGAPDWYDDEAYERNISNWLVVAYDENGQFVRYIDDNTYAVNDPNSQTAFEMKIPEGTYTFYAFANLGTLENGSAIRRAIVDGMSEEDLKKLAVNVGNIHKKFNPAKVEERHLIPMSSYGYKETVHATTELTIPLIRMVSKVRVNVTNQLDHSVTVSEIFVGKLQEERPIYLLPYECGEDDYYLEFRQGFDLQKWFAPSFPTEVLLGDLVYALNPERKVIAQAATETFLSYLNESMTFSQTVKSDMTITVKRQKEGGAVVNTTHSTDFSFVRRNDLLEIPIAITDLITTLKFSSQRLPIGVYPTEMIFNGEGEGIQVLTPVRYTIPSIGNLAIQYEMGAYDTNGWKIRYQGSSVTAGLDYSNVQIVYNDYGLLVDSNNQVCQNGDLFFLNSTEDLKGSFIIRSQELASASAYAIVRLTLIAEDNGGREIKLPYTIYIHNHS